MQNPGQKPKREKERTQKHLKTVERKEFENCELKKWLMVMEDLEEEVLIVPILTDTINPVTHANVMELHFWL